MKTEDEIRKLLAAIFNLEQAIPGGIGQHGLERVEGMALALTWALGGPLPGAYSHWFQMVQIMWKHGLTVKKPKRRAKKRRIHRAGDAFCE